VAGETGSGFIVSQAGFTVIPNMAITFWNFRFTISMPTKFFADTNQVFVNRVTYTDKGGVVPAASVICAVEFGDPEKVDTVELDKDWDKTVGNTSGSGKKFYELAGTNAVEGSGYERSWDLIDYSVQTSQGDKSKLSCIVRSEISPEEAAAFFDKTYTVELESRVYDNRESDVFKSMPVMAFEMFIPAPAFEFEPLNDDIAAKQTIDTKSVSYDAQASTGVAGKVAQVFYPGFVTNPYDDTVNDQIEFYFDTEAPKEFLKEGKILYQYVTFKKQGTTDKPTTVACVVKVGDPYNAQIKTFKGVKSFDETATGVKDKTWKSQNVDEKARKKDSFGLKQEAGFYKNYADTTNTNNIQPCLAVMDLGKKIPDGDPIYGTYEFKFGSRVYANDDDTKPVSLPVQEFTMTYGKPESDLAKLFEEDEPTD
jgi:hypothetical protein